MVFLQRFPTGAEDEMIGRYLDGEYLLGTVAPNITMHRCLLMALGKITDVRPGRRLWQLVKKGKALQASQCAIPPLTLLHLLPVSKSSRCGRSGFRSRAGSADLFYFLQLAADRNVPYGIQMRYGKVGPAFNHPLMIARCVTQTSGPKKLRSISLGSKKMRYLGCGLSQTKSKFIR